MDYGIKQVWDAIAGLRAKRGGANAGELQNRHVSAAAPSSADVLKWNATSKKWEPEAPSTAVAHTLDSAHHTDVGAITEANGKVLYHTGSAWAAAAPAGELGGTFPSLTVDATHSGGTHAATQAAAEATAAGALADHADDTTAVHGAGGATIAYSGGAFHDGFSDFVALEHLPVTDATSDPLVDGEAAADGTEATVARKDHVHPKHHAQAHAPESHTGTDITAVELETLSDTSDADALHNHPSDLTPAEHTAIGDGVPHHAAAHAPESHTGTDITAAELEDLSDGGQTTIHSHASGSAPSVRVYDTTGQSIPNNTNTALTFDTERFDTDGMHSVATNTSRLTATTAGIYRITGQVRYNSFAGGVRQVWIQHSGGSWLALDRIGPAAPADIVLLNVCTLWALAAAEYVELWTFQTSGAARTLAAAVAYAPEFMMNWVAPAP